MKNILNQSLILSVVILFSTSGCKEQTNTAKKEQEQPQIISTKATEINNIAAKVQEKYLEGQNVFIEYQNLKDWAYGHPEYINETMPKLEKLTCKIDSIHEEIKRLTDDAEVKYYGLHR